MPDQLIQDAWIEILSRFPVKFIVQCTIVCKSWYYLITSPAFMSAYLDRNQDRDDYLLVRHSGRKETYALLYDNVNFSESEFRCKGYFSVVVSCNGLVFLSSDPKNHLERNSRRSEIPELYVWNPSIRKSIKLPDPFGMYRTDDRLSPSYKVGFGFDRVNDDYKVVIVIHNGRFGRVPPYVALYKVSTGVWQNITRVAPSCVFDWPDAGVFVNGACHWVAWKRGEKDQNVIVLFDVHEETFREMVVPSSLAAMSSWSFRSRCSLFASEKSLCFVDNPSGNWETVDIWMMKEYGDPSSWVKSFSISSSPIAWNIAKFSLAEPIALMKDGEILLKTNNKGLVSYDPASRTTKNLGVRHVLYRDAVYVATYKASLTLLDKQASYCVGDTCEESSNICKRDRKSRRKK